MAEAPDSEDGAEDADDPLRAKGSTDQESADGADSQLPWMCYRAQYILR